MENMDAERDVYDELLTQAEIQGNVNKVNGEARVSRDPPPRRPAASLTRLLRSGQRAESGRGGAAERGRGQAVRGPEGCGPPQPAAPQQRLVPEAAAGRAGEQRAGWSRRSSTSALSARPPSVATLLS